MLGNVNHRRSRPSLFFGGSGLAATCFFMETPMPCVMPAMNEERHARKFATDRLRFCFWSSVHHFNQKLPQSWKSVGPTFTTQNFKLPPKCLSRPVSLPARQIFNKHELCFSVNLRLTRISGPGAPTPKERDCCDGCVMNRAFCATAIITTCITVSFQPETRFKHS